MALNWINVENYSFNSLLLLERFQVCILCGYCSSAQKHDFSVSLKYNPTVAWYLSHRSPESATLVYDAVASAPDGINASEVRECEVRIMRTVEDFIIYANPEIMNSCSCYIYGWDQERLFELADFTGKVVLDVGSGSGRLAFAAAEKAREVYACEPVGTLREYMRDKIAREHIPNVRVVDGMVQILPYPDSTFDIVMAGHVIGDDYDREISELTRVVKNGGWILDCPGEDHRKCEPDEELLKRGWEIFHYVSKFSGDVYRYRKLVVK